MCYVRPELGILRPGPHRGSSPVGTTASKPCDTLVAGTSSYPTPVFIRVPDERERHWSKEPGHTVVFGVRGVNSFVCLTLVESHRSLHRAVVWKFDGHITLWRNIKVARAWVTDREPMSGIHQNAFHVQGRHVMGSSRLKWWMIEYQSENPSSIFPAVVVVMLCVQNPSTRRNSFYSHHMWRAVIYTYLLHVNMIEINYKLVIYYTVINYNKFGRNCTTCTSMYWSSQIS